MDLDITPRQMGERLATLVEFSLMLCLTPRNYSLHFKQGRRSTLFVFSNFPSFFKSLTNLELKISLQAKPGARTLGEIRMKDFTFVDHILVTRVPPPGTGGGGSNFIS